MWMKYFAIETEMDERRDTKRFRSRDNNNTG